MQRRRGRIEEPLEPTRQDHDEEPPWLAPGVTEGVDGTGRDHQTGHDPCSFVLIRGHRRRQDTPWNVEAID